MFSIFECSLFGSPLYGKTEWERNQELSKWDRSKYKSFLRKYFLFFNYSTMLLDRFSRVPQIIIINVRYTLKVARISLSLSLSLIHTHYQPTHFLTALYFMYCPVLQSALCFFYNVLKILHIVILYNRLYFPPPPSPKILIGGYYFQLNMCLSALK